MDAFSGLHQLFASHFNAFYLYEFCTAIAGLVYE